MSTTKADRLAKIHAEAMEEFNRIQAAVREERMQCLADRRFYSVSGAQWEGDLGDQFENKPRFEFNRVHLAVIRIINEYRNNRITVDFVPKDGSTNRDLADACDGLYRADEHDSGAEEAYDNAFEEACGGGMGAWRLRAEYEDEDDDENESQRIKIEPIFDADSCVFFGLEAKRQDKADAKRCFVLSSMTPQDFEAEFGHDPASWSKEITQQEFDWCTPDAVYVAEYYRVEEVTELIHVFRGLDDEDMTVPDAELKDDPERLRVLLATGFRETAQKRRKKRVVRKYILSGQQVEEDCGVIAGKHIPIVPVYGKRWFVDGVERCMGHVRLAKDAQRLQNSLMSWLTDIASRFDVEKPILSPEQIAGHAQMWADDNVKRYPYLLANMLRDGEGNPVPGSQAPVAYTKAPNVPPAMAALTQIASQLLEDLLGNQQAGEQVQPNLSGKAVELIQNRLDMQAFIYLSNMGKAMKRSGEIWLSMARDVFVEDERPMKSIAADGEIDSVVINRPMIDEETGEQIIENAIAEANFDVWVDVGPSSSSRRAATVRALTGLAQITDDPQTRQVLTAYSVMNVEGEGISELQDYFRGRLVRQGVIKPTEEEKQELAAEMQNQKPDPQAQALLGMAEEAQANAAQARAKTVDTIAAADLKRAQTAKTWAEAAGEQQGQQLATIDALQGLLAGQGGALAPAAPAASAPLPAEPPQLPNLGGLPA
jgi:hypothetical protein